MSVFITHHSCCQHLKSEWEIRHSKRVERNPFFVCKDWQRMMRYGDWVIIILSTGHCEKHIADYIVRGSEIMDNIYLNPGTIKEILSCAKAGSSLQIFLDKELFFIGYEKNPEEKVARFKRK